MLRPLYHSCGSELHRSGSPAGEAGPRNKCGAHGTVFFLKGRHVRFLALRFLFRVNVWTVFHTPVSPQGSDFIIISFGDVWRKVSEDFHFRIKRLWIFPADCPHLMPYDIGILGCSSIWPHFALRRVKTLACDLSLKKIFIIVSVLGLSAL